MYQIPHLYSCIFCASYKRRHGDTNVRRKQFVLRCEGRKAFGVLTWNKTTNRLDLQVIWIFCCSVFRMHAFELCTKNENSSRYLIYAFLRAVMADNVKVHHLCDNLNTVRNNRKNVHTLPKKIVQATVY